MRNVDFILPASTTGSKSAIDTSKLSQAQRDALAGHIKQGLVLTIDTSQDGQWAFTYVDQDTTAEEEAKLSQGKAVTGKHKVIGDDESEPDFQPNSTNAARDAASNRNAESTKKK